MDILLVENDTHDEALTLEALRNDGIEAEVTVARDGVEALDYLFSRGDYAAQVAGVMPSLILLDIRMPRLDGLEVLRQVRADVRTRLLCVVMWSSSDEQRDIDDAFALGANSYVRKPVTFSDFNEAVCETARYWLRWNQPCTVATG